MIQSRQFARFGLKNAWNKLGAPVVCKSDVRIVAGDVHYVE
jgi:hypothetical protein